MSDALDDEFYTISLERAIKLADEESAKPNQLLSKDALTKRHQKAILDEFSSYKKQQIDGVAALIRAISESELTQETVDALQRIAGLSDQIAQDEKGILELIANGTTCLQELANVDDAVMDILYHGSKALYDKQLYAEASAAFQFLTSLNPKKYHFWQGVASAEYQQQHYKAALEAYTLLTAANPNDTVALVGMCHCLEELGDIAQALAVIDQAIAVAEKDRGEMQKIKSHLLQLGHR